MNQEQLNELVAFAEKIGISKSKLAEVAGCSRGNFLDKINPDRSNNLTPIQIKMIIDYLITMNKELTGILNKLT